MKISFDFDFTLTETHIQKMAKSLINAGEDVWILTARTDYATYDEYGEKVQSGRLNQILFTIAKNLGIPREKIIFTNAKHKVEKYLEYGFDMHFDDKYWEVQAINENGGNAVLVGLDIYNVISEYENKPEKLQY
jgi:hypothetical protein